MDTLKLYGVPGSGKTTSGLAWLGDRFKDGVDPWHVAFVSYTKAAVHEARSRIAVQFDLDERDLPNCQTIHALCYRQLKVGDSNGIADRKIAEFGKKYGFDLKRSSTADDEDTDSMVQKTGEDGVLLNTWNFARNRLCFDPEKALGVFSAYAPDDAMVINARRFKYCAEKYEEWKKAEGLRDFTDLLWEYSETGEPANVTCVVQDEIQDHTALMHKAADRLFANAEYSALLGDDDQAILNFAGAAPKLMNRREAREVRHLEHSWRCPKAVTDLAQAVICENEDREPKIISPREGDEGRVGKLNSLDRVPFLNGESWGILARNWNLLDGIASEIEAQGVPYHYSGWRYSPWSERGPLRAVRALKHLRETGRTTLADLNLIASKSGSDSKGNEGVWEHGAKIRLKKLSDEDPNRKVALVELADLGMNERGVRQLLTNYLLILTTGVSARDLSAFNAAMKRGTMDAEPITLSSIHGWKGRQFDNVICLDASGRNASQASNWAWRREEERRVAYVAITRARKAYYSLYVPNGRNVYPWTWADCGNRVTF